MCHMSLNDYILYMHSDLNPPFYALTRENTVYVSVTLMLMLMKALGNLNRRNILLNTHLHYKLYF